MLFLLLSRRHVIELNALILLQILAVVVEFGLLDRGFDLLIKLILEHCQHFELLITLNLLILRL